MGVCSSKNRRLAQKNNIKKKYQETRNLNQEQLQQSTMISGTSRKSQAISIISTDFTEKNSNLKDSNIQIQSVGENLKEQLPLQIIQESVEKMNSQKYLEAENLKKSNEEILINTEAKEKILNTIEITEKQQNQILKSQESEQNKNEIFYNAQNSNNSFKSLEEYIKKIPTNLPQNFKNSQQSSQQNELPFIKSVAFAKELEIAQLKNLKNSQNQNQKQYQEKFEQDENFESAINVELKYIYQSNRNEKSAEKEESNEDKQDKNSEYKKDNNYFVNKIFSSSEINCEKEKMPKLQQLNDNPQTFNLEGFPSTKSQYL